MAEVAERLIEEFPHSYPLANVRAFASGREIVVSARALIDGANYQFAARVPVPDHVGDALWVRFAEDSDDLESWVTYAVQVLFVESIEAGGLSEGHPDSDGVYWLDIWNQFPEAE
ncbi:MAG: hypothetical protein ACTH9T_05100 [Mycetocola reblochoni]|uniref:hypothetical protein n=1 Tax=Mycetocola reblochoni TaxID=331618 RepID=UPI0011C34D29|nr:hypothetical protein [Mycetocola reblochoni]